MHYSSLLLLFTAPVALAKCKCTPGSDCWPSNLKWKALNSTVHGRLITNQPLAKPCYNGDTERCQEITASYNESLTLENSPVGYQYAAIDTCPPLNYFKPLSQTPMCDLGNAPIYSINATESNHVAAGIKFAKENNVRLVIKNTGHDVRGRSQGYGSLSIWLKNMQPPLKFQKSYMPSNESCQSGWTGSVITVGAGYVWKDVYLFAAKHGVIAVGGDTESVGAVGGYIQGAGHGPASHTFGLASDQALEYNVVLASGEVVTANACQYQDLFTALRGGGGGTFGVVLSATIKAYPTRAVLEHKLEVVPKANNQSALIDAVASMLSKFSILSDADFAGIAKLSKAGDLVSYTHDFGILLENNASSGKIERAKHTMNREILNTLRKYNETKLSVISQFNQYNTFQDWYTSRGAHPTAAKGLILSSRFFDEKALLGQEKNLTVMLHTLFGKVDSGVQPEASTLEMILVGGGEVLKPQPFTSVNPAWRKTYMIAEFADIAPPETGMEGLRQVWSRATNQKLKAMKDITPGMGTYLNEANPYDPDWKEAWYGDLYEDLRVTKNKYDPYGVFWCWRCVGSEGWEEDKGPALWGPLCEKHDSTVSVY